MAEKQSVTIRREARELSARARQYADMGAHDTAKDLQRQADEYRSTAKRLRDQGK
jgi:hypothetical protein